jgi:hypothetical protein
LERPKSGLRAVSVPMSFWAAGSKVLGARHHCTRSSFHSPNRGEQDVEASALVSLAISLPPSLRRGQLVGRAQASLAPGSSSLHSPETNYISDIPLSMFGTVNLQVCGGTMCCRERASDSCWQWGHMMGAAEKWPRVVSVPSGETDFCLF